MKKLFLSFIITILLGSCGTALAQDVVTVTGKPGSDINFLPQDGKARIGSYTPLAQLPGIPSVIDPGVESGEAGSFTLPQYIRTIVRIAIGVIGVLAVVMIVVAGVQYMGSDMITEKESARSRLMGAVLGLILALSSVLLLRTINPQLTNLSIGILKESQWCAEPANQAKKAKAEEKEKKIAELTKEKKPIPAQTQLTEEEVTLLKRYRAGCADGKANEIMIPEELQISGGNDYLKEVGQYTGSKPNVTKNITTYDQSLKLAASKYGISCTVLKAHAYAESGMNPKATSKAGAKGLIQLMPKTFASTKEGSDPYDPATNARAAAFYLKQLSTQACSNKSHPSCTENPYSRFVTAAYNGGPGINFPGSCGKTKWECREKYKGGTNNETIEYVDRVWANINVLKTNGWGCD
jgi:hypothetical protein